MRLKDIDWHHAEHISDGGYGVIYRIAPSLIAKVAWQLGDEEIAAQLFFAASGCALPVLAYAHGLQLPFIIHQQCCGVHGVRAIDSEACICSCQEYVDVMIMPEAQRDLRHVPECEVEAFMNDIERRCAEEIWRTWDRRERNVAWFHEHLVALDFGDPDGPW